METLTLDQIAESLKWDPSDAGTETLNPRLDIKFEVSTDGGVEIILLHVAVLETYTHLIPTGIEDLGAWTPFAGEQTQPVKPIELGDNFVEAPIYPNGFIGFILTRVYVRWKTEPNAVKKADITLEYTKGGPEIEMSPELHRQLTRLFSQVYGDVVAFVNPASASHPKSINMHLRKPRTRGIRPQFKLVAEEGFVRLLLT